MSEFRLPSGEWRCTLDHTTEPCGECGGCREIAAINRSGVRDDVHNTPLPGRDFDRTDYTDEFWDQVPEDQRLGPRPTTEQLMAGLAAHRRVLEEKLSAYLRDGLTVKFGDDE